MSGMISFGSFRDPSGFIFMRDNVLYRQVNAVYKEHYDFLMACGLYSALIKEQLLVRHEEATLGQPVSQGAYKILKPEQVAFISYPYEWCFSQLKDAGLATLKIQKKALEFGMSLKDCSPYNIQFHNCKPVLIDTLSFEKYQEGSPWIAYRQFCEFFLAPLALISYKDARLSQLLRIHLDGIPLDLASKLLPRRTYFNLSICSHIHMHSRAQEHYADRGAALKRERKMSRFELCALIDSLESALNSLKWQPKHSAWDAYYEESSYSREAVKHKEQLVSAFLGRTDSRTAWDLGANTGLFSRIAGAKGISAVAFDIDYVCVERNYLEAVRKNEQNILPLVMDLTNPTAGAGWENRERMSLLERAPADTALALALVHHLAIGHNVPFGAIAEFFNKICRWLIIEFVPKNDSQAQRLLASREDIFHDYSQQRFEEEFGAYFLTQEREKIQQTERVLYLMESRKGRVGEDGN